MLAWAAFSAFQKLLSAERLSFWLNAARVRYYREHHPQVVEAGVKVGEIEGRIM
ncbi:MAG TPA: hypothetical protein VNP36_06740 [Burkholderiales bacterium]|nr:hypothetical protein [Burkholderiales bacterium]